jgi:hypothetical protein
VLPSVTFGAVVAGSKLLPVTVIWLVVSFTTALKITGAVAHHADPASTTGMARKEIKAHLNRRAKLMS